MFSTLITGSFDGSFMFEIDIDIEMHNVGLKDTIFNPFNYGEGHVFNFFSVGDTSILEIPALTAGGQPG